MTWGAECAGRADDQIKIRGQRSLRNTRSLSCLAGFRIELGEVNAFLSKHPLVKENVTIMREDSPGEKTLVSYVVPTDAAATDPRGTRFAHATR